MKLTYLEQRWDTVSAMLRATYLLFVSLSFSDTCFRIVKYLLYLVERQKELGGDLLYLFVVGSFTKCPQQPGLASMKPEVREFNPSFPCEWQGLKFLSQHMLPPKVYIKIFYCLT